MSREFKFKTIDYILYILQKIEPGQSTRLKVNKLAFFIEFGYLHKVGRELSKSNYAGINYGPVVNNYKALLSEMEKKGMIKLDGNYVRPLKNPTVIVPEEISCIIDPLIDKYSRLTSSELVNLSHLTDSYQITTKCGEEMGNLIDKNLAALESFYDEEIDEVKVKESRLPKINSVNLVSYEV